MGCNDIDHLRVYFVINVITNISYNVMVLITFSNEIMMALITNIYHVFTAIHQAYIEQSHH